MKSKQLNRVPKRSLLYLLICAAGAAAFYFLITWPSIRSVMEADTEISMLKAEIEEQKALSPVMAGLEENLSRLHGLPLPIPETERIALDELERLVADLEQAALDFGFEVKKIRSDTASRNLGEEMPLDFHLEGDWDGLRNYLKMLGGMGFIKRIERLKVLSGEQNESMSILITVILMTKTLIAAVDSIGQA